MPVPVGGYQSGPSCWDKMRMGFLIGFSVGIASGALFGGFTAFRYALPHNNKITSFLCSTLFRSLTDPEEGHQRSETSIE
uniref:Reactive oxygen species modulator 1 n=1 Tax=Panstrongylus lignarius TaxID=156445 RepID=A0A224XSW0_9HEMI